MSNDQVREQLYAVLRPSGVGFSVLKEYTSLRDAASFMKSHQLQKVDEKRFADIGLVQWIVA